jgi:hypothetical protein
MLSRLDLVPLRRLRTGRRAMPLSPQRRRREPLPVPARIPEMVDHMSLECGRPDTPESSAEYHPLRPSGTVNNSCGYMANNHVAS